MRDPSRSRRTTSQQQGQQKNGFSLPTLPASLCPDSAWHNWVTCPSCSPSYCDPSLSATFSSSTGNQCLLLDPFSVTVGLRVTRDTIANHFPTKIYHNTLHLAAALLCWHGVFCSKQEVGHRPSLFTTSSSAYLGFLSFYHL